MIGHSSEKTKVWKEGHAASVSEMIEFISQKVTETGTSFTAVDVGCGNGWVVRQLLKNKNCEYAMGIDGAAAMIAKAREIDGNSDYILAELPDFIPDRRFDYIHSMEFLYYLEDPENMLKLFYRDWLQKEGLICYRHRSLCRKRGKFKLARICWCGNGHADHRPMAPSVARCRFL